MARHSHGALAALLLVLLALPAPAQVRGLSPTSQYFDWHRLDAPPLTLWYSTPRTGGRRLERSAVAEATAERAMRLLHPVYQRLKERLGYAPPSVSVSLTGVLPADRSALRYTPSRGGATLYQAPEAREEPGTDAWILRSGGEQIAQAFLWHRLHRYKTRNPIRRYLLRRLGPAWFLLGMAAHLTGRTSPEEIQLLRASLADGREPLRLDDLLFADTLDLLQKEEAYQQARSFCGWLAEKFGVREAVAFLDRIRFRPTRQGNLFRRHFGISLGDAQDRWLEDFRAEEAAREAVEPPPMLRRLTELPGWAGGLKGSPDDERLAVLLNRRYNQGALMDLNLVRRFGEKQAHFLGGDPVLGPPGWLSPHDLVSVEETVRPFGLRVYRLLLRPLDHEAAPLRRRRPGLRGALAGAGDALRRLALRTVGQGDIEVLHAGEAMTEVAADGQGRRVAVLGWGEGRPEVLLFDLSSWDPEVDAGPPAPLRLPLARAYALRWEESGERLLALRGTGEGSELVRIDPDGEHEVEVLHRSEGRMRAAFGDAGRWFFTLPAPDGTGQLFELRRVGSEPLLVVQDPGGIRYPCGVEGNRWVAYVRLDSEGFELAEAPLPEPWERPEVAVDEVPEPPEPATPTAPAWAMVGAPPPPGAEEIPAGAEVSSGEPPARPEEGEGTGASAEGAAELELSGLFEGPVEYRPYRPRYNKRRDRYQLDEDALGVTFEWRDPFNYRSIQGAGWLGDSNSRGNWQALHYLNRNRPAWFLGAFDADQEDLLGIFELSDFNAAVKQRGALAGVTLQATPFEDWTLMLENKELQYDANVFKGRLPGFDPETRVVRLRYTRNELAASPGGTSSPIGERWLRLSLARSAFGGDADYWETLGDLRTYAPLARASDSIATRLVFGLRNPDQDPSPVPLDFTLGGPETLRGIQQSKLVGERFAVATLEVRRLLTDRRRMERVLKNLKLGPILDLARFNRVYAAFFLDMGSAWNGGFQWGRVERGVGFELRAQGMLTAFRSVTVRLGFAHGFGPLGENDVYLVTSGTF
jgi:hypothetical protein